jgi:hypothetical protein
MFKSPLFFGVILAAGWAVLAAGALTSLSGVAPFANPPHVRVVDTVEVTAQPFEVPDASVSEPTAPVSVRDTPARATL